VSWKASYFFSKLGRQIGGCIAQLVAKIQSTLPDAQAPLPSNTFPDIQNILENNFACISSYSMHGHRARTAAGAWPLPVVGRAEAHGHVGAVGGDLAELEGLWQVEGEGAEDEADEGARRSAARHGASAGVM
jgi:hypothetical protein